MQPVRRNPELSFEKLWETFHNRYPFFELRNVDWKKQYEIYRPFDNFKPVARRGAFIEFRGIPWADYLLYSSSKRIGVESSARQHYPAT
jgi:hypothetical protein